MVKRLKGGKLRGSGPRTRSTGTRSADGLNPGPRVAPLAPGDPQAIGQGSGVAVLQGPSASGTGNTVETNINYTMGQEDSTVLCSGAVAITLCPEPLAAFPVWVFADSGSVTVKGPIQGGPCTVQTGSVTGFMYSPLSGEWSVIGGGASQWAKQYTWYVDTVVGSDGNSGAAPGAGNALFTIAEVCRRMSVVVMPPSTAVSPNTVPGIVVNVNGPVASTDSFDWNPHVIESSGAAVISQPAVPLVTVTATLPAPGTTGTASGATAATTSASNTQAVLGGVILAGGTVGQIVQMTNGTASGYQACILKVSGNDARVSNWWLPGTAPYSGNGTIGAGPSSGDAYEILNLVNYAGSARIGASAERFAVIFQNWLFTSTAVVGVENALVKFLTCSVQCPMSAATNEGVSYGAALQLFGCAFMPSDHAITMFDRRLRFIAGGAINTTLTAFNTGRLEGMINFVVQGGANGGGIRIGRGYVGFAGDTSQNNGQLAIFNVGNTYGLGVFDCANNGTSDGVGVGVYRDADASIDAPYYGSGNVVGTTVSEGGSMLVRTPGTQYMTGTTELSFAGNTNAIPSLVGGSAVPAALACDTWAHWTSNFGSNVFDFAHSSGSKIITVANPD